MNRQYWPDLFTLQMTDNSLDWAGLHLAALSCKLVIENLWLDIHARLYYCMLNRDRLECLSSFLYRNPSD